MISGPDEIFWRYLELGQLVASPRPATPSAEEGWSFAVRCSAPRCRKRQRRWSVEDGSGAWVCATCGAAWGVWSRFRSSTPARTPTILPDRISELAGLRKRLDILTLWEVRLYLELHLWAGVKPYNRVAAEANKRWRRRERWTEWKARRCIEGARTKLWAEFSR
jgi:hypothetical protein